MFILWIPFTLLVTDSFALDLVNVYKDINEDSYITYYGEFKDLNTGGTGRATAIVAYDEDGKKQEYKLVSHNLIFWPEGGCATTYKYNGYFVYGKHSKIIVKIWGTKIE